VLALMEEILGAVPVAVEAANSQGNVSTPATNAWTIAAALVLKTGSLQDFGALPVGQTGAAISLSYTFTVGVTLGAPVALTGLAHSSGTLVQTPNPGASNAGAAFAGNFGGGLDLRASPRFSVRLIEADYLVTTFVTTFDNGVNNHQNNLRIGAGVVVRF
jgi:hypothetical protein